LDRPEQGMDILSKARQLESKLARTVDRAAQQWSKSGPRGPLEILHGILETVEERIEPAGRGTHVFAFNRIKATVVAVSPDARARFSGVMDGPPSLQERISTKLRDAGCDIPGLQVRVAFVAQADPAWTTPEFHVDFSRGAAQGPPPPERAAIPEITLTVINGSADTPVYTLTLDRINLGRCAEVRDNRNHLLRTNHVVFTDAAGAINETVSRTHAHIDCLTSGELRLFDDRSSHGTSIIRNGKTISVPAGSRGVRLLSSDEIVLGEARLRLG
jgi:FHA domain-containing protein